MPERAILRPEFQQPAYQRVPALDEPGVGQADIQLRQRHDHLRDGLAALRIVGDKAAVFFLLLRQNSQSPLHRVRHILPVAVFGQCLQRHGRDVRLRVSPRERPSAAGKLRVQNIVHIPVPRGLRGSGGVFRDVIRPAVQRQQCENGAVDPLKYRLIKVRQRNQQVESANVRGILPQRRPRQNHTGILRVLFRVEHAAVFRRVGSHVFAINFKIFLRYRNAGARQPEYGPLAPHGAVGWLRDLLHQPLGSLCQFLVRYRTLPRGRQGFHRRGRFGSLRLRLVCGAAADRQRQDKRQQKGDPFLTHNLCSYSLGSPVSPTAI